MAERYEILPDQVRAIVFGRTNGVITHQWAAVIGEATIYSASKEDTNALKKAVAQDPRIREYPYVNGISVGKVGVLPVSPGKFLDISLPHSLRLPATVVVTDLTNPSEMIGPAVWINRDLFWGSEVGVDDQSALILGSAASQQLYEIQEEKRKA